jgi:aspartyl-tRNA(Asn)/glutamyl-tRNA(Gln) amidotransferase subunit A
MRYGLRVDGDNLVDVYQQTRSAGFGDEVKRRILIGTYVLSAGYYDAYYLKALKVRRRIADDFDRAFENVDALLTPTAPSAAFGLGENSADPIAMYLNDIFTVTVNLAGLPAISVPGGLDAQGLPLGLQLIGRALDEGALFSLAGALEKSAAFTSRPERWW